MTSNDVDFDEWFETLQILLSEEGINFLDSDSVLGDYNDEKSVFDVVDEIKAEYS